MNDRHAARILIVEDERIVARDIQNRLTRFGYEVIGVTRCGEEALRVASQTRPDLVLMDIHLEGALDGIATAQELRTRCHVPVVYLTAYADDDTLARARVTEPFGYILKPFEERELRTVIEMALYKHQSENRLRESERRYAVTLSSIGDAVIATDEHARITFMNPVAESLTGYSAAEAIGSDLSKVFQLRNEQTGLPVTDPVAKVLQMGTIVGLANHTVLTRRDGSELPIDDSGAPIRNDEGRITGAVLVFHDVRERRAADALLRDAERKYRSIFENATEGIFQMAFEGPLLIANPALARMLGYASPDELCSSVTDVPEDLFLSAEQRKSFLDQLQTQGAVQGFECQLVQKTGETIWVSLDARTAQGGPNGSGYYEGTVVDITERKRMEERSRHAQKLEAIGQLAGGVAHDFNNILTVVFGFCELARGNLYRDHPLREHIEGIESAAERAADLTRQLLAFSRRQLMKPVTLDLNQVVAGTEKMLRRLIREDINVVTLLAPDLRPTKADPGQLEQVIINLAVNARDAMPKGGTLTIKTENVNLGPNDESEIPPGAYVRMTVADTGIGMDETTRARVFEPFFTTKDVGKGTGLGLATVYGVVEQSGGYIEVSSAVNQGAAFSIWFPAEVSSAAPARPELAESELSGGGATLLVVEDDDAIRNLTCRALREHGYTVLEAENGAKALELSRTYPGTLHLLLTDMIMPEMGGTVLARQLKKHRPDVKVLFMSGYPERAGTMQADLAPEVNVLAKPFSPTQLARSVHAALNQP